MRHFVCILLLLLPASTISSNQTRENMVKKGMYIPVTFSSEKPPTYFCYHTRKLCYVPGVSSGWRGWYRKGFSGYFIQGSWMYYMSRVSCPCIFPQPPTYPNSKSTDSLIPPK